MSLLSVDFLSPSVPTLPLWGACECVGFSSPPRGPTGSRPSAPQSLLSGGLAPLQADGLLYPGLEGGLLSTSEFSALDSITRIRF